jgi:hypothetical protein
LRLRGRCAAARRGAGRVAALLLETEVVVFLRATQLLLELLIAELQLLDLAGEHAHLVFDLVEAHDDIGGRHLRGRRRGDGASERGQQSGVKNSRHGVRAISEQKPRCL